MVSFCFEKVNIWMVNTQDLVIFLEFRCNILKLLKHFCLIQSARLCHLATMIVLFYMECFVAFIFPSKSNVFVIFHLFKSFRHIRNFSFPNKDVFWFCFSKEIQNISFYFQSDILKIQSLENYVTIFNW